MSNKEKHFTKYETDELMKEVFRVSDAKIKEGGVGQCTDGHSWMKVNEKKIKCTKCFTGKNVNNANDYV